MAFDITPYLTADNNAWLDTFVPAYIDAGKIDGKYYAVSYQPVIETVFINVDLFNEYGLEPPTTVDEMLAVCEEFAKHGIYGIGCWTGQNHQLLPWTYQIYAKDLAAKIDGCVWFETFPEIADYVMSHARSGDLVITLGCGDVYKCAKMMLEKANG